jgi:TRAP-type C4-dicarboxylate transport system substrate-binding protein
MDVTRGLVTVVLALLPCSLASVVTADDFKMSLVINQETTWGRAANRFADILKYRTKGRISITNYFEGKLFAGKQTTEFLLLQQGDADFAMGSTINGSVQVKELNLFALPFMFPTYQALDAVQAGEPGRRLFRHIDQKGVIPIAWGENGYRELTNSRRAIRRPEDLSGLKIRVVGAPIFLDTLRALGADPVSLDWNTQALPALRKGTVDGQENPIHLIIPYDIWQFHKHVTLWRYAIDPVILAGSGKTWARLSSEDRSLMRKVGEEIMAVQKREAREGAETALEILQKIYGMEGIQLTPGERKTFRDRTRSVYAKWVDQIGPDLVHLAELAIDSAR